MPLPIGARTRFPAARHRPGHTDLNPGSIRTLLHVRTQRPEIVSVVSADGVWVYQRCEDQGSTWTVRHLDTGLALTYLGSLTQARAFTFDPVAALADIRRIAAIAAQPKCDWRSAITSSICLDPADNTGRCGNPRHRLETAA